MKAVRSDVPYISDQLLKAEADQLLADYAAAKAWTPAPPVPVERIADLFLKLEIAWLPLETGTLAHLAAPRRLTINQACEPIFARFPGLLAFTIAHEIGHFRLHLVETPLEQMALGLDLPPAAPANILCRAPLPSGEAEAPAPQHFDRRELQAERFAAQLLMPDSLLRPALAGRDLGRWPTLYDLAREFGVTPTAMVRRLEGLKIITVVGKQIRLLTPQAAGQMTIG